MRYSACAWLDISDDNQTDKSTLPALKEESSDRYQIEKNCICTYGIVSSRLHNERNFYRSFKKDLRKAKQQVIIESPFMSDAQTKELLPIFKKLNKRAVKVIVYTRNPCQHDYVLRQQGFMAFKALKKEGVTEIIIFAIGLLASAT